MKVFLALVVLALTFSAAPSWAGPTPRHPAQVHLRDGEARYYARIASGYLSEGLYRPEKPHVGECKKGAGVRGRRLWRCPILIEADHTRCDASVWIWGSDNGDRYYEFHNLRCLPR